MLKSYMCLKICCVLWTEKITQTHDLKYLFILLLRHFDPSVQSQQFLQDVIEANHNLILLMEGCPQVSKEALGEHINQ